MLSFDPFSIAVLTIACAISLGVASIASFLVTGRPGFLGGGFFLGIII